MKSALLADSERVREMLTAGGVIGVAVLLLIAVPSEMVLLFIPLLLVSVLVVLALLGAG
jgi:hypothetical protein